MAARYLSDNFAPVTRELTETALPVIGTLPPELCGRYLRNGPNPIGDVDPRTHHWFIGPGMVHGVRLDEGRAAWYRNRWVRGTEVVEALGEDPGERQLGAANNTHVIGHAGRTWALVEAGAPPVELGEELDTVGTNPFFGTLTEGAFTAHPKADPETGELHAMAYKWPDFGDHVQYLRVGRDGRVTRTVDVPLPGMVMLHDMSLTDRYVVVYDLPVTVSLEMVEQGMRFPFAWNPEYQARVGLLPREGEARDIVWCEVAPCYVFHPMNAYDDDAGNVIVDVCRYDRMFDRHKLGPFEDGVATLDRWVIDPKRRTVSESRVHERGCEFPRCLPSLTGRPYRYGYSVAVEGEGFPAVNKHDLVTGGVARHDLGPGRHAGEAYFVPREGTESEDDGYLLAYVYDDARQASELVVLDARDMAAQPLARVMLPGRVPYGFHGAWIPDGASGPSV